MGMTIDCELTGFPRENNGKMMREWMAQPDEHSAATTCDCFGSLFGRLCVRVAEGRGMPRKCYGLACASVLDSGMPACNEDRRSLS